MDENEKHNVKLSKALSALLRHNMMAHGLKPTKEGFVDVEAVLRLPRFKNNTLGKRAVDQVRSFLYT